jgi:hypothetical protein
VEQTHTGQRLGVPSPYLGKYLKMYERHNNLNWLPSVANIPALQALVAPAPRASHSVPHVTGASHRSVGGRVHPSPLTVLTMAQESADNWEPVFTMLGVTVGSLETLHSRRMSELVVWKRQSL